MQVSLLMYCLQLVYKIKRGMQGAEELLYLLHLLQYFG